MTVNALKPGDLFLHHGERFLRTDIEHPTILSVCLDDGATVEFDLDQTVEVGSSSVWVLSTGRYSDWAIRGIYTTRERAEAAHAQLRGMPHQPDRVNDLEEYPLDVFGAGQTFMYETEIWIDSGETTSHYARWSWRGLDEHHDPFLLASIGRIEARSFVSFEHADKLAVEHRQQYLREQAR